MKRTASLLLSLLLVSIPVAASAQWPNDEDVRNPYQYDDVENGQLLQLFSYVLTPIGMGLEWGVTRPLHRVATQSALAPVLSGDRYVQYFGHNNNADFVPPGTFDPAPLNLSNYYVRSPPEATAEGRRPARQAASGARTLPPSQRTFQ
ncbi:MAG TPA: hypothetical protein VFB15_01875 [Candidatus Binataceae bacterium]|nr:hypothetical protein [Candidatus Binataceae bacterium]